jgi:hypothetical protein
MPGPVCLLGGCGVVSVCATAVIKEKKKSKRERKRCILVYHFSQK